MAVDGPRIYIIYGRCGKRLVRKQSGAFRCVHGETRGMI